MASDSRDPGGEQESSLAPVLVKGVASDNLADCVPGEEETQLRVMNAAAGSG